MEEEDADGALALMDDAQMLDAGAPELPPLVRRAGLRLRTQRPGAAAGQLGAAERVGKRGMGGGGAGNQKVLV